MEILVTIPDHEFWTDEENVQDTIKRNIEKRLAG